MWMWERAQLLGIPLMAGSSLPTLWRSPQFLEYPLDVELDEALSLGCEQPLPLHLLCLSLLPALALLCSLALFTTPWRSPALNPLTTAARRRLVAIGRARGLRLPRPRGASVHGRAAQRRRNRRPNRAVHVRRGSVEGEG